MDEEQVLLSYSRLLVVIALLGFATAIIVRFYRTLIVGEKSRLPDWDVVRFWALIGGAFGFFYVMVRRNQLLEWLEQVFSKTSMNIFRHDVMLAAGVNSEISPFLPYIASGILLMMGVTFVTAAGILLFLPKAPENLERIKAADNIVKTFGGFFTGLATTLLRS
jgi:hypothetical protein